MESDDPYQLSIQDALILQRKIFEETNLGDKLGPELHRFHLGHPLSSLWNISSRYAQAIANSIVQLRRYERLLIAWNMIIPRLSDDVREMAFIDYIMPLYHTVVDLPLIIKDQIIHAAVSLKVLSMQDSMVSVQEIKQGEWFNKLAELSMTDSSLRTLIDAINALWEPSEAKTLRDRHGNIHHDVERQFLSDIPFASTLGPGIDITGAEPKLDLAEEIEIINVQRCRAEKVYEQFIEFTKTIKLANCPTL